MIRVLIVDDSIVMQDLLVHILTSDKDIEIAGVVKNGREAIAFLELNKVDIVTMDICMPIVDGIEATKYIMSTMPVPIVMITGTLNTEEKESTFSAMQAGALSVLEKPVGVNNPKYEKISKRIIETVKLMSEIKVIKRKTYNFNRTMKINNEKEKNKIISRTLEGDIKAVAIGVSTGGPPVLETIFANLDKSFSYPILVVQHMVPGFLDGLVEWLNKSSKLVVQIAKNNETALPGHVYFAPDCRHMGILSNGQIVLNDGKSENSLKPAASFLFRALGEAYGNKSIAVLLTGMGKDGAEELKMLHDRGALTIAQDKETSAVYGMPGEAARLKAATYILSPIKIAEMLTNKSNLDKENKKQEIKK